MGNKSYFEKLKDPRWQKKRLEVMEAANFICKYCLAQDKTLNVHHRYYLPDHEPWDYKISQLECLCEDCHKWVEEIKKEMKRTIDTADWDELEKARDALNLILGKVYIVYDCGLLDNEQSKEYFNDKEKAPFNRRFANYRKATETKAPTNGKTKP